MKITEVKGRKNLSLSRDTIKYLEEISEKTKVSQSQIIDEIVLTYLKGKEIKKYSSFLEGTIEEKKK